MKVLLVNGSPHKDGCTNRALLEIKSTLENLDIATEIFWIGNKPISGCIACLKCKELGRCVINDVVNEFNEKAKTADGFVFGSAVHYAAPTGGITSFMDRVFYSNAVGSAVKGEDVFYMKPGCAIVSARRAGTSASLDVLNKYFLINEMPVVPSKYWNMVHGTSPDQVEQDLEGLHTMRTLANNMAYLLKAKKIAAENGLELPARESKVWTNFIMPK